MNIPDEMTHTNPPSLVEVVLSAREKRKEDETLVAHALYNRYGRSPRAAEIRGFLDGTPEEQEHIWNFGLPVPGPAVMSEGSNAAE